MIVERGKPCEEFYLVLSGKVVVLSGEDGFIIPLSTFSFFGMDSLTNDNYLPDFSARVSGHAKLLRISRIDYRKAISSVDNFYKRR